jgi:cell division protein FtsL
VSAHRQLDFEYAIRKDVRNNAIVREIDEERQRQLWRTAAIGAVVVIVLLFSIWQTVDLVFYGYQIQRLERDRVAEEEKNKHLRMEIETLRAPGRIEEVALRKLKLVQPDQERAIVLERVRPSAPPDKSVVAAR